MTGINIFSIDPNQWNTDLSTYFLSGKGHWAEIAGAKTSLRILSSGGEVELKYRVRTGSATNPIEYVPSYKIEVNGVAVPMILDTTKPNEKRKEFGNQANEFNSHIGYIKGNTKFIEGINDIVLTATRQFGGIDDWIEIIPTAAGFTKTQVDTMIKAAEDKIKSGYEEVMDSKVTEAVKANDLVWKAKFQLLAPTIPALQGVEEVIKQVMG
jgi:hypothetical protein